MPYVLLRHVETRQRVWFFNTHNPADVRGDARAWRDQGFDLEVRLAHRLRNSCPGVPLIFLGAKNETDRNFCSLATRARLHSASGGQSIGSTCIPPSGGAIDWIRGTRDIAFSGYSRVWNGYVSTISDHALYLSHVFVPQKIVGAGVEAAVRRHANGMETPLDNHRS